MSRMTLISAAAACFFIAGAGEAVAGCLEGIGCTDSEILSASSLRRLSCDSLWTARNTIYYEAGYCFQTARGRANFSNDGCTTSNQAAVRLNNFERSNVATIKKIEAQKGCE